MHQATRGARESIACAAWVVSVGNIRSVQHGVCTQCCPGGAFGKGREGRQRGRRAKLWSPLVAAAARITARPTISHENFGATSGVSRSWDIPLRFSDSRRKKATTARLRLNQFSSYLAEQAGVHCA